MFTLILITDNLKLDFFNSINYSLIFMQEPPIIKQIIEYFQNILLIFKRESFKKVVEKKKKRKEVTCFFIFKYIKKTS